MNEMFELNQQVAIRDWNYTYLGTITGETPKFWKVAFNGKEHKFYKTPRYDWRPKNEAESFGDAGTMYVLTDDWQAKINATIAEQAELKAIEDANRAKQKAFQEAETAWRLTPDGIAQTARENDLEGLEIQSTIDEHSDGTIYAKFSLVGQQQDDHASEVRPQYRYASVDVTRRTDRDWETGEVTYREPQVSVYGLNNSVTYVRNMQRLVMAAVEYAETLSNSKTGV